MEDIKEQDSEQDIGRDSIYHAQDQSKQNQKMGAGAGNQNDTANTR